jgi:hypothetical protein
MTNPTLELNNLRDDLLHQAKQEYGWIGQATAKLQRALYTQGKSADRIYEIVYNAEQELNIAILDIVTDSLQQVLQLAVEYGMDEFINNISIQPIGGVFEITTIDGKTDYTEPAIEMLPKLLQNGKTSKKDGSIYRVIPLPVIKGESRRSLSNIDAISTRAEEIKQAKQTRQMNLDAGRMTQQFANSMPKVTVEIEKTPSIGKDFRTASSKQDSSTQWVKPEKKKDITFELLNINQTMVGRIEATTQYILNKYGG